MLVIDFVFEGCLFDLTGLEKLFFLMKNQFFENGLVGWTYWFGNQLGTNLKIGVESVGPWIDTDRLNWGKKLIELVLFIFKIYIFNFYEFFIMYLIEPDKSAK